MADPVLLRPATSDLEEGMAFARYFETATDGLSRLLFGARAEQIVAKAYLSPGHDLSHEYVTFAQKDEAIVGMLSGYTASQHRRSSDSAVTKAAGPLGSIRMLAVTPFALRWGRFMNRLDDGDYYVQAVAVDDDARGQGIGSQLLDLAENTAIGAGCSRLALDVACTNASAQRLYERRGIAVAAQSPGIAFVPDSSVLRMVKQL
jgi:ribosomal protein S18 acetylase RimI-like enzyme